MAERRTLWLGDFHATGNKFDYKADTLEFDVREGEEVDLALNFGYAEDRPEKEGFRLALAVAVGDESLGTQEAHVEDRPMVKDEAEGTLRHALHALKRGAYVGTFVIEADYDVQDWGTGDFGPMHGFRHVGKFVLNVR